MVVDSVMDSRCISWWQTLSWDGGVGETIERRYQERLLRWSRISSIMAADYHGMDGGDCDAMIRSPAATKHTASLMPP